MTDPMLPGRPSMLGRWWRELSVRARSAGARNAGKLGGAEIVVLMVGLVQSVFVARWLGPRDFGVAALVTGFTALVFTFFDPQASEALVKYLGEFVATGDRRKALAVPKLAYAVDAVLAALGFAVVAGLATTVATHLLNAGEHADLLAVAAAAQMLAAPGDTSRAILATFGRFSAVAAVQVVTALGRLALVVVVVGGGGGVGAFVVATAVGTATEAVIAGLLAERAVRQSLGASWWQGRRSDVSGRVGEMGRFLVYTDLTSLVAVFVKQADLVILGLIRGPVEAGYYRLARSLSTPVGSMVTGLQTVAYPRMAELVGLADEPGVVSTTRRWFLRAGLPLAGLSLVGLPLMPFVIDVVAGSEFSSATAAAQWLLVGSAFVLACFWLRPVMLATGHVRYLFLNSTVAGATSVLGFVLLADAFGAAGVAASRALFAGVGGTGVAVWHLLRLQRDERLLQDTSPTTKQVIG